MITTFLVALCALAISLYVQAWFAARDIRRHRTLSTEPVTQLLVLENRPAGHISPYMAISVERVERKVIARRVAPRVGRGNPRLQRPKRPVLAGESPADFLPSASGPQDSHSARYQLWLQPVRACQSRN